MRINKIRLHNFRNFEDEVFEFPSLFTVIIGDNGKGKSSLLQGLRLAAASFLLGLDEPERLHIQKEDIRRIDTGTRFAPQQNCSFEAWGVVAEKNCRWKRTLSREGGKTDMKDAYPIVEIAEELNQRVNIGLEEEIDLPVICFFSTARLWEEPKQAIELKKKGSKLKDGYSRCLDVKSDKISPLQWIKSNYYKQLKGKENGGLLEAVLEAVTTCVAGWSDLEWDEDYDDLAGVYKADNGSTSFIPLYYLSDGQRTMASMVAEIAYRCVILNDHLGRDAVKKSKGVVLIDEIDMHLHPNWQRSVASDLKKAFPEIQFVATTHSPFILQSLSADELINLDRETDIHPKQLSLEDVAESIMGVESPFAAENVRDEKLSSKYLSMLEKGVKDKRNAPTPNIARKLDEMEAKVSDPAVRAFLRMKRLEKNAKR
jgi:predicted ATP-binding protein involved in virulence